MTPLSFLRPEKEPDGDELELVVERSAAVVEMRLLRRGREVGRLAAERSERRSGLLLRKSPHGPAWCRSLLLEAASEWARETETQGRS
jgi:hypothetical protein